MLVRTYKPVWYVPTSVVPEIISVEDVSAHKTKYGAHVLGKTQPQFIINAKGIYGAAIKKVVLICTGGKSLVDELATPVSNYQKTLTANTNFLYTTSNRIDYYVLDTRGREWSGAFMVNALTYNAPTLEYKIYRCNAKGEDDGAGEYCKVEINNYAFTPLNNQNSKQLVIKKSGLTLDTITPTSYSGSSITKLYSAFSTDSSYKMEVIAKDDFSDVDYKEDVDITQTLINFKSDGTTVAFGGLAKDSNRVEFYMPTTMNDALVFRQKDLQLSGSYLQESASGVLTVGERTFYPDKFTPMIDIDTNSYRVRKLMPSTDNSIDLGSSSNRWNNIYGTVINGEKICSTLNEYNGGIWGAANDGTSKSMMYISAGDNIVINFPTFGTGATNIYGGTSSLVNFGTSESPINTIKRNGHQIMDILNSNSSTAKSVASGSWTSTNSKLSLHAGIWVVCGRASFAAATGKRRGLRFYNTTNSSNFSNSSVQIGGSSTSQAISTTTTMVCNLTSAATITLQAYQDTGSALNVSETQMYAVCVG